MTDSPRDEVAHALAALARAVKRCFGYTPTDARLDVVERPDKPIRLTFPLPNAAFEEKTEGNNDFTPDPEDDNTCRLAVVAVLQKSPRALTSKEIARAGGLNAESSHFRETMSAMKKDGTLVCPGDSSREYWLASRPLP